MTNVIPRSIASLRHKAIWWLMMASSAGAVFILLSFIWLTDHLLNTYQLVNIGWVETLIENLGVVAAMVVAWLLFPVTIPAIAALFEDKAAEIIEANEYGKLENPQAYPWRKEVSFLLWGLFLNILFLPLYVIPVLNIFTYYFLNSWLLGKGLFMLMASRYHGAETAKRLYKEHRLAIKLYGLALVFMTNIPLLNLIAPLFGVIVMLHYSRSLVVKA